MIKKEFKPLSSAQTIKKTILSTITKPITNSTVKKPTNTTKQPSNSIAVKKPVQKEVPEKVVLPSTKTINSTASTKQNEEQKQNSKPKIQNFTFIMRKRYEVTKYIKEIDAISKMDVQKINVIIDSKIESDQELLSFSVSLTKIAPKIRNFTWKIEGKFTDYGQAIQIGELIGRLSQVYSINLEIKDTYFADRGAGQLAIGLKKLQNLRILNLQVSQHNGHIANRLTSDGIDKITQGIWSLSNLQIVKYKGLTWTNYTLPKNIGNYVFEIVLSSLDFEQEVEDELIDIFEQKIKEVGFNLIDLRLTNRRYLFDCDLKKGCFCEVEYVFRRTYRKFLNFVLNFSLVNLPYLTRFQDDIYFDEDEGDYEDLFKPLKEFQSMFQQLLSHKRSTIARISVFNSQMLKTLTINPAMILSDLWID